MTLLISSPARAPRPAHAPFYAGVLGRVSTLFGEARSLLSPDDSQTAPA
jgi:hypothetical protein